MANIKDVAQRSGVTVTTVSRVLNNRGYISEKTRNNVYKAMEELDYQPNELARALFRRKSNLIGFIIPDVAHPFLHSLQAILNIMPIRMDIRCCYAMLIMIVKKNKIT